ncbi:hypothetical protein [Brachyspira sp. G79]|uniref:hypothetical protein n=1 Tax=Brachyspira sp. G79 TaxID=1358104 RepID=UPI001F0A9485|nr:hypothetical protein [Brachyspira sp. G79]
MNKNVNVYSYTSPAVADTVEVVNSKSAGSNDTPPAEAVTLLISTLVSCPR